MAYKSTSKTRSRAKQEERLRRKKGKPTVTKEAIAKAEAQMAANRRRLG